MMGRAGRRLAMLAALLYLALAQAAPPLPALTIDRNAITVSGISSGAYMAVQLQVAYSATFRGVGVIAGGPYDCAMGSAFNATGRCMAHDAPIPVDQLVQLTMQRAQQKRIDPVADLAKAKAYVFAGTRDDVVRPAVADDLVAYLQRFTPAANIAAKRDIAAGHGMVTEDFGNACPAHAAPYLNDCDFDLAGALLQQLYGPLSARNNGPARGDLVAFDQRAFVIDHGMGGAGWVYVPQDCRGTTACRLHVALHGCRQNALAVGEDFARHAGFNRWADTNRIVVLYPQTGAQAVNGCWDWWGYDSPDYALKVGPQMAAIKAMVDRASGVIAAPTRADPCVSATNWAHSAAGRAYLWWGRGYAVGTDESLGWWFAQSRLQEVTPGRFETRGCH